PGGLLALGLGGDLAGKVAPLPAPRLPPGDPPEPPRRGLVRAADAPRWRGLRAAPRRREGDGGTLPELLERKVLRRRRRPDRGAPLRDRRRWDPRDPLALVSRDRPGRRARAPDPPPARIPADPRDGPPVRGRARPVRGLQPPRRRCRVW